MALKFYEDEAWLRQKYHKERLTPEQIAEICGVSHMTIRRWIQKHGL